MTDATTPPRDMTKPWEGNRQRRRRRLASELNDSGRWLARPLETDPVPDAPGVYLSDTIYADPRFDEAGDAAVALWTRALLHSDRRIVNGHAAIAVKVVAKLRRNGDAELALIDTGLWRYDHESDSYLFADPGQVYAIVGSEASQDAPKRVR